MDVIVSAVFSMIGAGLQYLRSAGVSEEVVEANWSLTKEKFYSRPSEDLEEVPD